MKLNKVVNYFKSKSVVDFVYLVMMILIVTMIKDMVVSMYRKRKDKQWLNKAFGKAEKSGASKTVERFSGTGFPVCENPSTVTSESTVCEKLKFLLCDVNIDKLRRLLNGITTSTATSTLSPDGFHIKTYGGSIWTIGGVIKTEGGFISTNGGTIKTAGGTIETSGGDIETHGGNIVTEGGNIVTEGGNIETNNSIKSRFLYVNTIFSNGNVHIVKDQVGTNHGDMNYAYIDFKTNVRFYGTALRDNNWIDILSHDRETSDGRRRMIIYHQATGDRKWFVRTGNFNASRDQH